MPSSHQERTYEGGGGDESAPLNLKNTIFSRLLSLNYAICVFAACVLKVFIMWEDRVILQHGKDLM